MTYQEKCQCCGADIVRAAYITSDNVWMCRACFYAEPRPVPAGATPLTKGVTASAQESDSEPVFRGREAAAFDRETAADIQRDLKR